MVNSEVCWASLVQPKSLMKIGLCMVLVGHVNFLLGALVHGIVLRHISIGAQTPEYAISNILALTAGLVGVLVGILAIVLSKNEKSQPLSTTLILWVLLIIMSVVEVLFSGRCLAVCINFIRRKPALQYEGRSVKTLRAAEPLVLPAYTPPTPLPRRRRGEVAGATPGTARAAAHVTTAVQLHTLCPKSSFHRLLRQGQAQQGQAQQGQLLDLIMSLAVTLAKLGLCWTEDQFKEFH
ncbi:hypothetical protein SRHO_G00314160 [Serrasalmus rhombeus]